MRCFAILSLVLLAGCVSAVKSVVTAPFKVVGQAADWATTSQDEADRNRGRAVRKAEERARKDCKRDSEDELRRERCVRDRLAEQGFNVER